MNEKRRTVHACHQVGTKWRSRVDDAGYADGELIRNKLGAEAGNIRLGARLRRVEIAVVFWSTSKKAMSDR